MKGFAAVVLWVAVWAVAAAMASARPPGPTEGQRFIDEVLAKVQANDWKVDPATWPSLAAAARRRAADTTDTMSAYPIVADLLWQLGDEHGALDVDEARTAAYRKRYGRLWSEPRAHRPASALTDRAEVTSSNVALGGHSVRVVVLPGLSSREDEQAYARRAFDAVAGADGACGFVLDLRGNVGGDMWPMLAAVSPLLGTDLPGAFTSRSEGPDRWFVREGRSGEQHADARIETVFTLKGWQPPPARLAAAPVAVLLDEGTMSAGEAVAIAFAGRAASRSFGKKTYGMSTANTPFSLGDGTRLWMAIGVYRDRLGHDYPAGVTPDEEVDAAIDTAGHDPTLVAAESWLAKQPGCN